MGRAPNAYDLAHYNPIDGGESAKREALKDPAERLRFRQAALAERINAQIHDGLPAEDVEGLIQQHVELTGNWRQSMEQEAIDADTTLDHRRQQAELLQEVARQHLAKADPQEIDALLAAYLSEARDYHRQQGPKFMGDRIAEFTGLREAVITCLLRQGEVMNLVSETKVGKSWMAINLALTVATGGLWLNKFAAKQGQVLYLDNELQHQDSTWRVMEVARSMGIDSADYAGELAIENFRGKQIDIDGLARYFLQFKPRQWQLIIFDAGYRFQRMDSDENSNSHTTAFYNTVNHYATELDTAIAIVHHGTKGAQGSKRVTDVGAGAGAQSRAADTHCVLRAHEENDVFVLDAACRTWPRITPLCLRWNWPLWTPDFDLDPSLLRTDRPRRQPKVDMDGIEKQQPWTAERFATEFASGEAQPKAGILDNAIMAGVSNKKATDLLNRAIAKKLLHRWPSDDKRQHLYAAAKPPEQVETGVATDVATEGGNSVSEVATDLETGVATGNFFKRDQVLEEIGRDDAASDREIAKKCGVSHTYVSRMRRENRS